jgi:hypothetical protein
VSLLFDTSPEEPQKRRGRRSAPPPAETPTPEKPLIYIGEAAPPLGRLDGTVTCPDENCQSQCHEILDEVRGQWRIECVFCGTGQWVPVVRGHLPPPPQGGGFVLRGGRFDGKTIDTVARLERGMDYLAWAAKEHPRPSVKKACQEYLAGIGRVV